MADSERWLVLGAASWLGYLLLAQEAASGGAALLGTIYRNRPEGLAETISLLPAQQCSDYQNLAENFRPSIIINFLRGEDEEGFAIHAAMAAYGERAHALYVYVSSVLALDGHKNMPLTENLPPRSDSVYGIFKGRCENHLQQCRVRSLILRFASVQGWVPHKATRNEQFLRKLAQGQSVTVETGIVQNRLSAGLVVEAIRSLARDRVTGVVHLGATDASEEIDFLRAEAKLFGWNPAQVVPGAARPVNLNCQPGRIFQLYGNRFRRSEADTLNHLAQIPGLQRWRKPGQP